MLIRHDMRPEFMAELTGTGPYAAVDIAVVNGVVANLRNGRLAGLTGDAEDESGEKLVFDPTTGKWKLVGSDGPNRVYWGHHDRLPWMAAFMDRISYGRLLQHVMRSAMYNLLPGYSMPTDGTVIDFRHKDRGKLGWDNRQESGLTGHHTYMMEDVIRLMGMYPAGRPAQIYKYWDERVKLSRPNAESIRLLPRTRDTHALLVQAWMAYCYTGDEFYRMMSLVLCDHLTAVPLSEHSDTQLNDPLWPYTLCDVMQKSQRCCEWILDAAEWAYKSGSQAQGLTLSACAWLLTRDDKYLLRNAQVLWDYCAGYLRAPGTSYDWIGQEVGRTGELVSTQWPFYRWVLGRAGSNPAFIAKRPSVNNIPLARDPVGGTGGGLVVMTGANLNDVKLRYRSWVADAKGGSLTPQAPAAGLRAFQGPFGGADGYVDKTTDPRIPLAGPPITKMLVMGWQQHGGPLTNDPTETYQLEANKWYELGNCYGYILTGTTFMNVKPLNENITIYDGLGKPILGMIAGMTTTRTLSLLPNKTLIDARGTQYARWAFKLSLPGTWQCG